MNRIYLWYFLWIHVWISSIYVSGSDHVVFQLYQIGNLLENQKVAIPMLFQQQQQQQQQQQDKICQTVPQQFSHLPIGYFEHLVGNVRTPNGNVIGSMGKNDEGRLCFQAESGDCFVNGDVDDCFRSRSFVVDLENSLWYRRVAAWMEFKESFMLRQRTRERLSLVLENWEMVQGTMDVSNSLLARNVFEISALKVEIEYLQQDIREFAKELKFAELDSWVDKLLGWDYFQGMNVSAFEDEISLVSDQVISSIISLNQSLDAIDVQEQDVVQIVRNGLSFVAETSMLLLYSKDLYELRRFYDPHCSIESCMSEKVSVNLTVALGKIISSLRHFNISRINEMTPRASHCLGDVIQSTMELENAINEKIINHSPIGIAYGRCLSRFHSIPMAVINFPEVLPLPTTSGISTLELDEATVTILPMHIDEASFRSVIGKGRSNGEFSLNLTSLLLNAERIIDLINDLPNPDHSEMLRWTHKRNVACHQSCPDGQGSHCEGDDIVCTIVPPGLWAKDGYTYACTNAPDSEVTSRYTESGVSSPDCPFECIGRRYKVCLRKENGKCEQYGCPMTPIGKYSIDGQDTFADCQSLLSDVVFTTGGTIGNPNSCLFAPRYLVQTDAVLNQGKSFYISLSYKADVMVMNATLQKNAKSSLGMGFGLLMTDSLSIILRVWSEHGQLWGRITYAASYFVDLKDETDAFLMDDDWHDYVVTYDAPSGFLSFYRDAIFVGVSPFRLGNTATDSKRTIIGGSVRTFLRDTLLDFYLTPGNIQNIILAQGSVSLDFLFSLNVHEWSCQSENILSCQSCSGNMILMQNDHCQCPWNHYWENGCHACPLATKAINSRKTGIESCICHDDFIFDSETKSCVPSKDPFSPPSSRMNIAPFVDNPEPNVVPLGSKMTILWPADVKKSSEPDIKMHLSIMINSTGVQTEELPYIPNQDIHIPLNIMGEVNIQCYITQPQRLQGIPFAATFFVRERAKQVVHLNGTRLYSLSLFPLYHSDHGKRGFIMFRHFKREGKVGGSWETYSKPLIVRPLDHLDFYFKSSNPSLLDSTMSSVDISIHGTDSDHPEASEESTRSEKQGTYQHELLLSPQLYSTIVNSLVYLIFLSVATCVLSFCLCISSSVFLYRKHKSEKQHAGYQQLTIDENQFHPAELELDDTDLELILRDME